MTDPNTKIKELARKAYELESKAEYSDWQHNVASDALLENMYSVFVEFAKLVASDCAMIAYNSGVNDSDCCANSILYAYDIGGSRSDK